MISIKIGRSERYKESKFSYFGTWHFHDHRIRVQYMYSQRMVLAGIVGMVVK